MKTESKSFLCVATFLTGRSARAILLSMSRPPTVDFLSPRLTPPFPSGHRQATCPFPDNGTRYSYPMRSIQSPPMGIIVTMASLWSLDLSLPVYRCADGVLRRQPRTVRGLVTPVKRLRNVTPTPVRSQFLLPNLVLSTLSQLSRHVKNLVGLE